MCAHTLPVVLLLGGELDVARVLAQSDDGNARVVLAKVEEHLSAAHLTCETQHRVSKMGPKMGRQDGSSAVVPLAAFLESLIRRVRAPLVLLSIAWPAGVSSPPSKIPTTTPSICLSPPADHRDTRVSKWTTLCVKWSVMKLQE